MELFMRLFQEEEGQGLVEYALIIALISLVAIAAMGPVGTAIAKKFSEIGEKLGAPAAGGGG